MATRIRLLIERRLVCRTFKLLLRQIDDPLHLRRRLYGKAEPERLHPVDLRHLIQQIQDLAVEYGHRTILMRKHRKFPVLILELISAAFAGAAKPHLLQRTVFGKKAAEHVHTRSSQVPDCRRWSLRKL